MGWDKDSYYAQASVPPTPTEPSGWGIFSEKSHKNMGTAVTRNLEKETCEPTSRTRSFSLGQHDLWVQGESRQRAPASEAWLAQVNRISQDTSHAIAFFPSTLRPPDPGSQDWPTAQPSLSLS